MYDGAASLPFNREIPEYDNSTTMVTWRGRYGNQWTTRIMTAHLAEFTEDVEGSGGEVLSSEREQ